MERHGGPTEGKHVSLIFTPPSTFSVQTLYGSLLGLGSSLRLVIFSLFAFSLVAYSLTNCRLVSNLWLVLFLQRWVVRYGLITPGTDLVLREFP